MVKIKSGLKKKRGKNKKLVEKKNKMGVKNIWEKVREKNVAKSLKKVGEKLKKNHKKME